MQKLGMNEDEYAEYQYNKLRNKADNYNKKEPEMALFVLSGIVHILVKY